MKAVVYEKYGPPDVLELRDVPKPVAKNDEVLVKVHATSVNHFDWHVRAGTPFLARMLFGLMKPKVRILGFDLAGRIESVGAEVKQFGEGDEVYGFVSPGINGANAEYVCVPEGNVVKKPANITYEEAAAAPVAATQALQFLKAGNIQSGHRVLMNGASGGLGAFAVQLAKSFGAEVTAVCSAANLELVQSIGADEVIDYTKEDFTKSGQTYDIVFDVVAKSSFSRCRGSLNPKGTYVTTAVTLKLLFQKRWTSMTGGKKAMVFLAKPSIEDLNFVNDLLAAGNVRSVIDRCYPLSQIADAHRHVEKGHTRGKVIVTVQGPAPSGTQ